MSKKLFAFCASMVALVLLAWLKADAAYPSALGMIAGAYLVAQGGRDTAAAWKQGEPQ